MVGVHCARAKKHAEDVTQLTRMADRGDPLPLHLLRRCLQRICDLEISSSGGDALLWMVSPVLEAARRQLMQDSQERRMVEAEADTFRQRSEMCAMEVEDQRSKHLREQERIRVRVRQQQDTTKAMVMKALALLEERRELEASCRQLELQDLQVAPEAPKRLQVLVLHGRQSNANLANFQISGLKTAFGKDGADVDFDFLEGALPWTYRPGVDLHDADPMSINLSKGKEFKVWFTHTTDDKRDRPDLYKQQDPGVCVTYDGVEAAVEMLLDRVSNGPRVDVVVAMFEGSIVVHLAAVKLMSQGQRVPWPVTVFFGSLPIRDDRLLAAFADGAKITHPTIHVFGKNDEYYFYGRRGAGRLAPEDYYEAPLILEHIEGHRLPSLQPQAGALYAQVVKEVKVCCGVPLDGGYDPSECHSWRRSRRPAKPLAPPVLEMEQMIPRKLRILALTGGHSCTEVLRYQLAPLRQAVGRDLAATELQQADGVVEHLNIQQQPLKDWNWYEGEPIVSDMEQKLAKGAQLKNWYMDSIYEEL
eukprot:s932_g9.t1